MTDDTARMGNLKVEVEIDASPTKVWKALTRDMGKWWPAEFYSGGSAGARAIQVELEPGGRMFETWDEGGGTLWGNVVSFAPNKTLQILGQVFPNWGGPTQWYGTWLLEPVGNKTRLSFSEAAFGRITRDNTADKEKGWLFLSECLKAFVQNDTVPAWSD